MKSKYVAVFAVMLICVSGGLVFLALRKTPDSAADPRFQKADLNKDGRIDETEFRQYAAMLGQMKLTRMKVIAEEETDSAEILYGLEGQYMESALGYAMERPSEEVPEGNKTP
ncbi:MAG: hypothetical protein LBQ54_14945 [Planctomycetaceae bacterium]|jgi:hypothetical protein|nr:hypothetical protein [Planctomycetaceae bacterium]